MNQRVVTRWQNWGRTQSATVESILTPRDRSDLERIIYDARKNQKKIKVLGAGHSFSGISQPEDIALRMDNFRGMIAVDQFNQQVTLGAGTYLYEIPALLAPYGLAMQNLGDIDRQTLAGAVSTGTHGTGVEFGGIATQIRGVTIMDGQGNTRKITQDNPEFPAVALSLGTLGIITEITVQCVPQFVLQAMEEPQPLEEILANFYEIIASADHFEFFWFPHTTRVITKTLRRLSGDAERMPLNSLRKLIEDRYITNFALKIICEINHHIPSLNARLAALASAAMGKREYSDYSAQVLISAREVRFRESEWALPLENLIPAFRELIELVNSSDWPVIFPVEVRTAAADELMLSTAQGRKTGYIAVHEYYRDISMEYFQECERIMVRYEGRPHWGKMHSQSADFFRKAYSQYTEFLKIRDAFDPERIFTNSYVERVLGK